MSIRHNHFWGKQYNLTTMEELNKKIVCVVELGHPGLPLAETFVKYFRVIGFDANENRYYI